MKLLIALVIAITAWTTWYVVLPNVTAADWTSGVYCYTAPILNDGQLDDHGMMKRAATVGRQCSTTPLEPTATPFALPTPTDHYKVPAGGM